MVKVGTSHLPELPMLGTAEFFPGLFERQAALLIWPAIF